ncbi:hypothetical protein V5O48_011278, partial [Marasmius crinis-equi]
MHPDVPDVKHVGESGIGNFLDQLILMTFTFAVPELVAMRASKERIAAGIIQKKYQKYGWTKAHAYLVLMGGLALYDKEGQFRGYLRDSESFQDEDCALAEEIEQSLKGKSQSTPMIATTEELPTQHEILSSSDNPYWGSEKSQPASTSVQSLKENVAVNRKLPEFLEPYSCLLEYVLARGLMDLKKCEIQDNLSHGDVLAKLSALLSTGGFLVQLFARVMQGLAVSELEAITLSFTALTFVIYLLSWNKPQRVRYPIRVTWEPTSPKESQPMPTRPVVPKLWKELRNRIVADFHGVVGTTKGKASHMFNDKHLAGLSRGAKAVTIFHPDISVPPRKTMLARVASTVLGVIGGASIALARTGSEEQIPNTVLPISATLKSRYVTKHRKRECLAVPDFTSDNITPTTGLSLFEIPLAISTPLFPARTPPPRTDGVNYSSTAGILTSTDESRAAHSALENTSSVVQVSVLIVMPTPPAAWKLLPHIEVGAVDVGIVEESGSGGVEGLSLYLLPYDIPPPNATSRDFQAAQFGAFAIL